jgi:hypothetical protein
MAKRGCLGVRQKKAAGTNQRAVIVAVSSPVQERPICPHPYRGPRGSRGPRNDRRMGEGGWHRPPKRRVWTVEWRAAVHIERGLTEQGVEVRMPNPRIETSPRPAGRRTMMIDCWPCSGRKNLLAYFSPTDCEVVTVDEWYRWRHSNRGAILIGQI